MKSKLDYAVDELTSYPVETETLIDLVTMYTKLYIELGELEFAIKADKIFEAIGEEAKIYNEEIKKISDSHK